MDRFVTEELFGMEGFSITWYGVIFTFGMVAGTVFVCCRGRSRGMDTETILDFVLWAFPISILSARLYYVIFQWDYYKDHFSKILAIREGGLAIFGGVIGGLLTLLVFCKKRNIDVISFLDLSVPGLLLGQIIGRWGNYTNQEAFGAVVMDPRFQRIPFAVYIEELSQWHQATFLYESAGNLLLLLIILILERNRQQRGLVTALYLIGYGTLRFLVEGMRTDSLYVLPGIRVSQILALLLIPVGIWLLNWGRKRCVS